MTYYVCKSVMLEINVEMPTFSNRHISIINFEKFVVLWGFFFSILLSISKFNVGLKECGMAYRNKNFSVTY